MVVKYCELDENRGDCQEHLIDGDVTKIEMFSDTQTIALERSHLNSTEKIQSPVPAGFRITTDAGQEAHFTYEFGDVTKKLTDMWEGRGRILGLFAYPNWHVDTPAVESLTFRVASVDSLNHKRQPEFNFDSPVVGNVAAYEMQKKS